MSDMLKQTVRIAVKPKISSDDRGRSVWAEPVEEVELELVSTLMLKQLIESDDDDKRNKLAAAAQGKDGVLAKNLTSGRFEIIDDDDLMAALQSADSTPDTVRASDMNAAPLLERADTDNEELSLVSTQALRKILGTEESGSGGSGEEPGGGFDPYNNA